MVEFILSGTKSHFDLVISSHVAYVFSTKPVHAFCSFIKRLIWYFYTSVKKMYLVWRMSAILSVVFALEMVFGV